MKSLCENLEAMMFKHLYIKLIDIFIWIYFIEIYNSE